MGRKRAISPVVCVQALTSRERPAWPKLDQHDLTPAAELVGLDGEVHLVAVEARRHVEREVGGDLNSDGGCGRKGHEAGGGVHGPA